jgi:hypothetical protein
VKFTPGGDDFPSPCVFCSHQRHAEGICRCGPDCPSCSQGCCGRVVQRVLLNESLANAATYIQDDPLGGPGQPPPRHIPFPDPYPDELDMLLCEEDETRCEPGRPCLCCYAEQLEGGRMPTVSQGNESR